MDKNFCKWTPGTAPVAVIMISLNEAHNLIGVIENIKGWAQEVFLVDSFSKDETVGIALSYGIHVVQRKFTDFGDQWNFALEELPINAPWVMKLDPDERLTTELKHSIKEKILANDCDGMEMIRRLWFMGKPLSVSQSLIRVWRAGRCKFTKVDVNEHPIINGLIQKVNGELIHYDSPDLEHWLEKQNNYTTSEALMLFKKMDMAVEPSLFGSQLQKRMWFKKNFDKVPFRYLFLFIYVYFIQGAWKSGWVGLTWAKLRVFVMQMREYKYREMLLTGALPTKRFYGPSIPDIRVPQYSSDKKYIGNSSSLLSEGAAFHETIATSWSSHYSRKGFEDRFELFLNIFDRVVKKNSRWVDLGCGSGVLAKKLLENGAHVLCVDQSPSMIEIVSGLQKDFRNKLDVLISDITRLDDVESEIFNGVLASSVLEYLDYPKHALEEMNRLLLPNGVLIITIPSKYSIVRCGQKYLRQLYLLFGKEIFSYIRYSKFEISRSEIKTLFHDAGFTVTDVSHFDTKLPAWLMHFLAPSLFLIVARKKL